MFDYEALGKALNMDEAIKDGAWDYIGDVLHTIGKSLARGPFNEPIHIKKYKA